MKTRDGFLLFWGSEDWPSQWHLVDFEIDGRRYNCAEQWMMAEKARTFGDDRRLAMILAATSPREQKNVGRQVSNFDAQIWESKCKSVVFRGSHAKFTQNPDLERLLLETGDLRLVEASPSDRIWGIGLSEDHPDATRPGSWRGKNWLGKALMKVRAAIREGREAPVAPICPYCSEVSSLVKGDVIYPGLPHLHHKSFWKCGCSDVYVGCHPGTDKPLGRLADAELRGAKLEAHGAFDRLWKSGLKKRSLAYVWLAKRLGIDASQCHIGMFDVLLCKETIRVCEEELRAAGEDNFMRPEPVSGSQDD